MSREYGQLFASRKSSRDEPGTLTASATSACAALRQPARPPVLPVPRGRSTLPGCEREPKRQRLPPQPPQREGLRAERSAPQRVGQLTRFRPANEAPPSWVAQNVTRQNGSRRSGERIPEARRPGWRAVPCRGGSNGAVRLRAPRRARHHARPSAAWRPWAATARFAPPNHSRSTRAWPLRCASAAEQGCRAEWRQRLRRICRPWNKCYPRLPQPAPAGQAQRSAANRPPQSRAREPWPPALPRQGSRQGGLVAAPLWRARWFR